jgi:hypothetical protein
MIREYFKIKMLEKIGSRYEYAISFLLDDLDKKFASPTNYNFGYYEIVYNQSGIPCSVLKLYDPVCEIVGDKLIQSYTKNFSNKVQFKYNEYFLVDKNEMVSVIRDIKIDKIL